MKFLPGMPNTEIEAQYYSKLLMLTSAALVESGFDSTSTTPVNPAAIVPNRSAVRALYAEMLSKALNRPETMYGSSPAQIARAKIQTLAVADKFPDVMKDLIAVGVKTHFVYYVVAKSNGYKQPLPDVLEDRPGQMDAFGIASGLVAIHTRRTDNSFIEFVRMATTRRVPIFTGFSKANGLPVDTPGMTEPVTDLKARWRSHLQEHPGVGAASASANRCQERQLGSRTISRELGRKPGRLIAHARLGSVGHGRPAHGERAHSRAAQPVHRQPAATALSVHQRRSGTRARGEGALQDQLRQLPHPAQPDDLSGSEAGGRRQSHEGQHERVPLRPGRARDRGVQHLRSEQQGTAGRRLVRASRRLAGEARRVLPRHAPACRRRHRWIQGRHAPRHLGSGALPAQRVGSDAGSAGMPVHPPAAIPSWEPELRRGAGRASSGQFGRAHGTARARRCSSRSSTRPSQASPTPAISSVPRCARIRAVSTRRPTARKSKPDCCSRQSEPCWPI